MAVAWVAAEEHAFTFGMQRVTRPCDKQQCADEPHKDDCANEDRV